MENENKKKGKVNSIVEPYAMRKKCPYGCSILSSIFFYLFDFDYAR